MDLLPNMHETNRYSCHFLLLLSVNLQIFTGGLHIPGVITVQEIRQIPACLQGAYILFFED